MLRSFRECLHLLKDRGLHFKSHIGQDAWVAECFAFRRGGFFLDFGAFDGQMTSNTYALERDLGWRGICVEPNPRYYPHLCRSRHSITINAALWPKSHESLRFVDAHGLSAIETLKDSDANASLRSKATLGVFEVETLNPTDLLNRFAAPQQIEFLSLDVEGAEYEVLTALDLNVYSIALMTIEHNHDRPRQQRIREHLASFGYEAIEHCNDDFFYNRGHLAKWPACHIDPVAAFERVRESYGIRDPA